MWGMLLSSSPEMQYFCNLGVCELCGLLKQDLFQEVPVRKIELGIFSDA